MHVLSLFDGISCARAALDRAWLPITTYFASEIDTAAISVAKRNYPTTTHLGSVKTILSHYELPQLDILIGGSPCQGFSQAGLQLGFTDERSKLLLDYIDIKNTLKPKWFVLENVVMKKQDQDTVSRLIGVSPIMIDSALFSGQRRKRLYWTNIPIPAIQDKQISVMSIIDKNNITPSNDSWHNWFLYNQSFQLYKGYVKIVNDSNKAATLTARQYASWNGNVFRVKEDTYRWLTPIECERLQTLPDDYTKDIPLMERYKALGNGFTVDVIAHILGGIHAARHVL